MQPPRFESKAPSSPERDRLFFRLMTAIGMMRLERSAYMKLVRDVTQRQNIENLSELTKQELELVLADIGWIETPPEEGAQTA